MGDFLRKYSELFFFIPVWLLVGAIFMPAGVFVVFITLAYWYSRKKYEYFIISFILFLILADSRASGLSFHQSLRIPFLTYIMFFAVEAIYRGVYGIRKIFFYAIPFFFVATMCVFRSPTIEISFAKTISYFFLIFVVIHYFPYIIIKTKAAILFDVVYFVAGVATLGLLLYVIYPQSVSWYGGASVQYKGFFANPNGMGLYCTLMVPFTFISSHIFPKKKLLLYYTTFILSVSTVLCDSRTAMGCLFLFFSFYFFFVFFRNTSSIPRKRIGRWAIRFFWWILLPLAVLVLYTFGLVGLIETLGLGESLEAHTITNGAGRIIAWQHAIEGINKTGWWFGKGFHYDVHYFREMREILSKLGHSGGSHNSYLAFVMNVGVVGLGCFLFFLYKLFSQIRGEARNFIVPYLAVILFSTNFESWLSSSINFVTIFFYLTIIMLIYFDAFKAAYAEENCPILIAD